MSTKRLPALMSLTLVTALAAFFLLYTSAFTSTAVTRVHTQLPEGAPGHDRAEMPTIAGLGAYVVTTALLAVPLLWWLRWNSAG